MSLSEKSQLLNFNYACKYVQSSICCKKITACGRGGSKALTGKSQVLTLKSELRPKSKQNRPTQSQVQVAMCFKSRQVTSLIIAFLTFC